MLKIIIVRFQMGAKLILLFIIYTLSLHVVFVFSIVGTKLFWSQSPSLTSTISYIFFCPLFLFNNVKKH